jgi:hypothetical protein
MTASRTGEVLVGLAFAGLGAAALIGGLRMPEGSVALPGPGFAPAVIGTALLLVGLGCALQALRASHQAIAAVSLSDLRVWLVLAVLAGTAAAFEPLGAAVSIAVSFTLLARIIGRFRWWVCVVAGLIAAGVAVLVFGQLLGVRLPSGEFGF